MSDRHPFARSQVLDVVGLSIQDLHTKGWLRGSQPLLRIDNSDKARRAPFQLDAVTGRLHRAGCRSIPKDSTSALYGIWRIGKDDQTLACPRCKPMPKTDDKTEDPDYPTDLLYGLISVVSQFGGVLRERGQEYRNSRAGKLMSAQIEHVYRGVNEREKNVLDVVLTSLDELANAIRDLNANVNGANGHDTGGNGVTPPDANGHDIRNNRPGKSRRQPKAAQDKSPSP
jgi:hypothetical protein